VEHYAPLLTEGGRTTQDTDGIWGYAMKTEFVTTSLATLGRFIMTTVPFVLVMSVLGEILAWLVAVEIGMKSVPVGCCDGWEGLAYLMLYAYLHIPKVVLVTIGSGILAYLAHWGFRKCKGGALFVSVPLSIGVIVLGTLLLSFYFPLIMLLLGMLLPI
jgi:hypothetical protein